MIRLHSTENTWKQTMREYHLTQHKYAMKYLITKHNALQNPIYAHEVT